MLADLKVVETSNKDDGRTVEKIKGVNLIGKEAGCNCTLLACEMSRTVW